MSKIPNFYAMSVDELFELQEADKQRNQKYLAAQLKKGRERSKKLGNAAKATKTVADATKEGGLLRRLIASFGKSKE